MKEVGWSDYYFETLKNTTATPQIMNREIKIYGIINFIVGVRKCEYTFLWKVINFWKKNKIPFVVNIIDAKKRKKCYIINERQFQLRTLKHICLL